jgi:hypothetical protein
MAIKDRKIYCKFHKNIVLFEDCKSMGFIILNLGN